jgi:hypothetical protein
LRISRTFERLHVNVQIVGRKKKSFPMNSTKSTYARGVARKSIFPNAHWNRGGRLLDNRNLETFKSMMPSIVVRPALASGSLRRAYASASGP